MIETPLAMSNHASFWHEYILLGCLYLDAGHLIVSSAVSTATAMLISKIKLEVMVLPRLFKVIIYLQKKNLQ